jgi:hypothetical protein
MGDEKDGNKLGSIPWDCVIVDEVRPAQFSQDPADQYLLAIAGILFAVTDRLESIVVIRALRLFLEPGEC